MKNELFKTCIGIIAKDLSVPAILVGSDLFPFVSELNENLRECIFFGETPFLKDKIMFYSKKHPLSGRDVSVEDIIELECLTNKIRHKSKHIFFPNLGGEWTGKFTVLNNEFTGKLEEFALVYDECKLKHIYPFNSESIKNMKL